MMAWLRLSRAPMSAALFAATYVGSVLAREHTSVESSVAAATVIALTAAGGFMLNDVYDVKRDAINAPDRPIPSGKISPQSAKNAAIVIIAMALVVDLTFTIPAQLLELALVVTIIHYSRLKRNLALVANLVTALACAVSFIYGALTAGNAMAGILPAALTLGLIFGREIIKDAQDQDGDRLEGIKTLPILIGESAAAKVACICWGLVLMISMPTISADDFAPWHVLFILTFDVFIAATAVKIWRQPSRGAINQGLRLSMYALFFGIAAFVI